MRLVFLGAPGAGKGTQAQRLAAQEQIPHISTGEILRRLSGRRSCSRCQTVYHIEHDPPKEEGVCDKCGATLVQRADDKPETVLARLRVFDQQTRPLVEYYQKRGLLQRVNATGSIDQVYARLLALVHATRMA